MVADVTMYRIEIYLALMRTNTAQGCSLVADASMHSASSREGTVLAGVYTRQPWGSENGVTYL